MSTGNKKQFRSFNFNSYKNDRKSARKSLILDIVFGLLLAAMCILLMSTSFPEGIVLADGMPVENRIGSEKIKSSLSHTYASQSATESVRGGHISVKKNEAIVN